MTIRVKLKRGIVLNTPGFSGVRTEPEYTGPIEVREETDQDGKPSYRITGKGAVGCYLYKEDTLPYIKTMVVIRS